MNRIKIALVPDVHGVGGMVSFRDKFSTALAGRGIDLARDLSSPDLDAVLVIGGTRRLAPLKSLKKKGIPIVQRLDGMNWLHRKLPTGLRHWLRAEMGNLLLNRIRLRLASRIVYQSAFSKQWWERAHGPAGRPDTIIHNAVDLQDYSPEGAHERPGDHLRLLLVEGSLQGGYEVGLENAVALVAELRTEHHLDARLAVAGKVSDQVKASFNTTPPIRWLGLVPPEQIPFTDRSAHLLFSADLNAACPNAVIEALACGLPVAAFDTGALAELVGGSGAIAAYGGDPWKLDPPDISGLAQRAARVLQEQNAHRAASRRRAERLFGLDKMVDNYLHALAG